RDEAAAIGEWSEEDMLGGADPMTWLETLARRQGADLEELTTEADLEIPELPEDTIVDEPGYTEYSPLGILPPRRDAAQEDVSAAPLEMHEEETPEPSAGLEALGDSLGWLSDMSEEPEGDLTAWPAIDDAVAERELGDDDASEPDDALAGMTDEEIELARRGGELTGEQELAWLQRTARNRAAEMEETTVAAEPETVEPAEPAELPSWLEAMRDAEMLDEEAVEEAPELALEEDEGVSEDELAALLEGGTALDEADALAEALAAELEGDLEAEIDESALAEAEPIEMPDWLVEADDESSADADLPAWLIEPVQEGAAPAEDMPDWLNELSERDAEQTDLAAAEAFPAAEVDSLPEQEFFTPQREAPIPEGELFATYRQRLHEEPGDHASRLALARTLRNHGEVAPSLDHYETLI